LPPDIRLPTGLRRTTGETLVALVSEAEHAVRFAAPYVDEAGLGVLTDVAAAATRRGVGVEVFQQARWGRTELEAVRALRAAIAQSGDQNLKVLVVDGVRAYIGSANMTAAALAGRNLELGVLVRGPDVGIVDRLLDLYREARWQFSGWTWSGS
jgi:phosphatidylserine/phosphatidylglycerophosphate/cardiolipin synthase-like enzyme